jgi:hypothetical protein
MGFQHVFKERASLSSSPGLLLPKTADNIWPGLEMEISRQKTFGERVAIPVGIGEKVMFARFIA